MRFAVFISVLAGALLLGGAARAQTSLPVTEDATVAVDGNGVCWLSFMVKEPKAAELAIKIKVSRPTAKAPGPGLPVPVAGRGDRGSWIWIGEGAQQGKAALFTLSAAGNLTWEALTPRVARMYLPSARGH
jgi:hypothetical protein